MNIEAQNRQKLRTNLEQPQPQKEWNKVKFKNIELHHLFSMLKNKMKNIEAHIGLGRNLLVHIKKSVLLLWSIFRINPSKQIAFLSRASSFYQIS